MKGFGKSVVGKIRKTNEDAILVLNEPLGVLANVFVVADGMGGHLAGGVASVMAINEMKSFLAENVGYDDVLDAISDAILYANEKIHDNGLDNPEHRGMGTTLLAATVIGTKAFIVNVGDSRLYAINPDKNEIKQITVDHSYVQELLAQGKITADEAEVHPNKNIITRALGTSAYVECDRFTYLLGEGDILLICSDGLTNMLSNNDILAICKEGKNAGEIVDQLLDGANEKGGIDNISVIMYA